MSSYSGADMAGIRRANSSNNPLQGYDLSNAETNYGGFYQPAQNKLEKQTVEKPNNSASQNIKPVQNSLKLKDNSILIQ